MYPHPNAVKNWDKGSWGWTQAQGHVACLGLRHCPFRLAPGSESGMNSPSSTQIPGQSVQETSGFALDSGGSPSLAPPASFHPIHVGSRAERCGQRRDNPVISHTGPHPVLGHRSWERASPHRCAVTRPVERQQMGFTSSSQLQAWTLEEAGDGGANTWPMACTPFQQESHFPSPTLPRSSAQGAGPRLRKTEPVAFPKGGGREGAADLRGV